MDPNDPTTPAVESEPAAGLEPAGPVAPATEQPAQTVRAGTGIMPAVVTGIVLAAAVLAFVAQNTKRVAIEWLWLDFHTTPGVLVLVALFLGVVTAVIVGVIVRRNRRIRLNEREELDRLRGGRQS